MKDISSVFRPGHKALVAYVMGGYPSFESTIETIQLLEKSGVDMVEIGIPFSDPLADGATIQNAGFEALNNGATVQKCIETANALKNRVNIPLLFMTYFNPVMSFGIEKFCRESSRAGISGLIIPDLPPEEAEDIDRCTAANGQDLIYLITPNTDKRRISSISRKSRGFIYLVSVTGITGARKDLPSYLGSFISRVKIITPKPLCIGFGISSPAQAAEASRLADGVIIGSKIVQIMGEPGAAKELKRFIITVRTAMDTCETGIK
jgi:tryptophan synthase alpha chain